MLSSFRGINKIVLLITLVSLASNLQKGSFIRHFMPSMFQLLLVLSVVLTIIYIVRSHQVKDFFLAVPKNVLLAIGCFFLTIFVGWGIAIFFLDIPTTVHTILDFGTFMMGMVLFFLVSFYAKNDTRYAKWCLYAILIPNIYLVYYFLTHGIVGYWGVENDFSLDFVLDPNILSKVLLVPAIFFVSTSLFALMHKRWWMMVYSILLASLSSMLVFWTVSRGGILSLCIGAVATWVVFSFRAFTWKKFFLSGATVLIILSLGYVMLPGHTKQAIVLKSSNTFTLPPTSGGKIANVTVEEIRKLPQTESRLLIWYFYPRYIAGHPFGVGPNASYDFNFQDKNGSHIYVGPESTYLVVALWGGILGLIIYLYIMRSAFVELWNKWKRSSDSYTLALMGVLFTLLVVLFFDGNMSLYWLYVVLALAFQKNEQ